MFLKVQPIGTNIPADEDRMPLWKVVSGDDCSLTTKLTVPGHPQMPVSQDNSKIVFTLAEDRFTLPALWTGRWDEGILPVDPAQHPGLVVIRIPDAIASALRRGVYSFSITVSDHFGRNLTTVMVGNIQVEYEPTSPMHNIPYRSST